MTIDITGTYDFNDGTNVGLTIRGVDAKNNNALVDSFIRTPDNDIIPITGSFDASATSPSGQIPINFSAPLFPGSPLSTNYVGGVIPGAQSIGGVLALAGFWTGEKFTGGAGGPAKPPVTVTGFWLASNHQIEIV